MVLNIYDYNKLILKNIIVLIPKFKENMLSFLAPIIGIYGIKINLFIEEFEKKTNFFDIDIIIPVKVIIYKINTFDIIIELPYLNFFLNELYNNVNILYLFKLSFLKSNLNLNIIQNNYKMIRSYIKSLQLLKNNFMFCKYNFYILNNIENFKFFKNLIINYNYINLLLKYNYGYYCCINNFNYYKFIQYNKDFKFIKIKKKFNFFLFLQNIIKKDVFYFFKNLFMKNKLKLFFIKYLSNKLSISFFEQNFILKYYDIFNLLKIKIFLLFKFLTNFNYFNKFLFNFKNA
jgi:hypothetical protein